MAEPKTKKTDAGVEQFLAKVTGGAGRQEDARALATLMQRITKAEPKMWGKSIVGFGTRLLRYPTGRELDWFRIGFSPRAKDLVVYAVDGIERLGPLLSKLGKHSTGKGCLYLRSLGEVDVHVLEAVLREAATVTSEPAAPAKKTKAIAKKAVAKR